MPPAAFGTGAWKHVVTGRCPCHLTHQSAKAIAVLARHPRCGAKERTETERHEFFWLDFLITGCHTGDLLQGLYPFLIS